jgi:hypothetical protein
MIHQQSSPEMEEDYNDEYYQGENSDKFDFM